MLVVAPCCALIALWLLFHDPQRDEAAAPPDATTRGPNAAPAPVSLAPIADSPLSSPPTPEREETAPAPPQLLVSVLDERGAALPGAGVWLVDEFGERRWSTWTGDEGQCAISSQARLGAAFVHASAPNYFDAVEPLAPSASQLRLVLASALLSRRIRISGAVERDSGGSAGPDVNVLLTGGAHRDPSGDEVLRLLSGATVEGLQLAHTDERGGFEFEVDSQAGPFGLRAGARGWAMQSPREAKDGVYTILRLARLHGARVRLRDGESGLDAPSFAAARAAVLRPAVGVNTLSPSDAALALAGLGAADLAHQPSVLRYVLHDRQALERSGPHRLDLRLPGFEPATYEFEATALEFGFADNEVRLIRTVAGFGRLRVQLGDASAALQASMQDVTLSGTLILRSDGDKYVSYPCTLSLDAPALIEGVPFGEYEVEFAHTRVLLMASRSVLVTTSQTEVVLSLARCGAARLTTRQRNGSALLERIECRMLWESEAPSRRGTFTGNSSTTLRASPTLLAPLMAGDYELLHPRLEHGETSGSFPFIVRPGELSEVEVLLGL